MVRVILVTGKGGVGKTTLASATAVAAADGGASVLLVSTDAAHSLSDVVDEPIGMEPTPIGPSLHALQLDARHELQRSWSTIAGYLRRLLGLAEVDRLRLDELVVVPGLEQLVALARLRSLSEDDRWDAIVVDCAPSADSLRLLTLPQILHWYVDRMFGREGTIARWGRRHIERTLALPLPDDGVLASMEAMGDELMQLQALFADGATTARVVTTPERVVVAEAQRTMAYLALYGYAVDAVLVNRAGGSGPGPAGNGQRAGRSVSEVFAGLPQRTVRQRPVEPIGVAALREVGMELYGEGDPLARLAETPPLQITSNGGESIVRLFVPGAKREEIQLELDDGELLVTIGAHRRAVTLPDGLRGRPVARAGLNDQHLEVVFGEVAHA
jgi:arsenite-transporting ATPase